MKQISPSSAGILERFVKGPVGFRELLQHLGPTFIKVGQFLALRPDLVPQEYCDELMALLDQVPPFPWEQASVILKEDLRKDPDEIFAVINPRPVAAGSLAQTHAARLHDGSAVAIKIQRPNIRARVLKDLSRARLLARVLTFGNIGLAISPNELVNELTNWLMQELDFKHELANLNQLHRLSSDRTLERIPKAYPEFCGDRILTLDFLQGVPVSEIIAALRSGRPEESERVARLNTDWNEFASNLMNATLEQIFRARFFHADPHPGNLLLLPGNTVGYVDFGLCSELDENVHRNQLRYFAAVYGRNVEEMFRSLTELLIPPERPDLEAFRMDFLKETSLWLAEARVAGGEQDRREVSEQAPVSHYLTGLMRAARKHGYQIPTTILAMYRALLSTESIARELAPAADLRSVERRFFNSMTVEEAMRSFEPERLQGWFLNFLSLWRDSPAQFRQLLNELADGKFALRVEVAQSSRASRAQDRRTKLIVTAILSVGVALLAAQVGTQMWYGIPIRGLLIGLIVLLYISAFVQWRRLR